MNLGGLSAVHPGFMAQENQTATTEQNQYAAREAAYKLLGAQVLGRALTGGQAPPQPSQPMAPPPGQASVPMQRAPAQMAPPGAVPQAAPALGPVGAPVAHGGGGMPELSLQALTQRILQTTPQVRNNPEILMAALERAAPLLDRQSKEDLMELRRQMQADRLTAAGNLAQARADALKAAQKAAEDARNARAGAAEDGRNARAAAAEGGRNARSDDRNARTDRRLDQSAQREERLAAAAAIRQDQGFQRLQLARDALERRIVETNDKKALSEWRVALDAQHKRAQEIIQSSNINANLKPAERAALLAEQDAAYRQAIDAMRQRMGGTTPTGGTAPVGAPAAPKIQGQVPQNAPVVTQQAPPPVTVPPAVLKQAQDAIAAGAPRDAVIKRLQEQGYPTDGL